MIWLDTLASDWPIIGTPMLISGFAGLVLGFLGVFLVARRMVFLSAAVSQTAALGLAVGFLMEYAVFGHGGEHGGGKPLLVSMSVTLAALSLLAFSRDGGLLSQDSRVGLVFVLASAGTLLIAHFIPQESQMIQQALFGTGVQMRVSDQWFILGTGSVVLLLHLWFFRGTVFAILEPEVALAHKVPVVFLRIFVYVSVGLMIAASTRALGSLPVFALTTLPAMGVMIWVSRMPWAFATAAIFGGVAGFGGYFAAYLLDVSVGPSQAVAAALPLIVALGIAAKRWVRR